LLNPWLHRSTLPSEAIEEFLSILRPSSILFPPTSPILRPSNGLAHGFVPYRRPGSCSMSPVMTNEGLGITLVDQNDNTSKDGDTVAYPFKLISATHLCTCCSSQFSSPSRIYLDVYDRCGLHANPLLLSDQLRRSPVRTRATPSLARPTTRAPLLPISGNILLLRLPSLSPSLRQRCLCRSPRPMRSSLSLSHKTEANTM
jgi:hypothetical protein